MAEVTHDSRCHRRLQRAGRCHSRIAHSRAGMGRDSRPQPGVTGGKGHPRGSPGGREVDPRAGSRRRVCAGGCESTSTVRASHGPSATRGVGVCRSLAAANRCTLSRHSGSRCPAVWPKRVGSGAVARGIESRDDRTALVDIRGPQGDGCDPGNARRVAARACLVGGASSDRGPGPRALRLYRRIRSWTYRCRSRHTTRSRA